MSEPKQRPPLPAAPEDSAPSAPTAPPLPETPVHTKPLDQRSLLSYLTAPGLPLRSTFYVGAIASAASGILAFLFLVLTLGKLSQPDLFLNTQRGIDVFESIRAWGIALILFSALLSMTAFLVALRQSHRVAGPLYRIDKYLGLLLSGHYQERVSLRESDEFRDIADKLNTLADRLEAYSDPSTSMDVTKV